ncbi:MAG: hypothetical protein AB9903_00280 [Vulcanimicrobiota bacterium]
MSTIKNASGQQQLPFTHSAQGREISRQYLEKAEGSPSDARSVLADGLNAVLNDTATTADEKELAKMGLNSTSGMSCSESVKKVRAAFTKAIGSDIDLTKGKALAQVAIDAADAAGYSKDRRVVLNTGLATIVQNPVTTAEEKMFAQLGLDASSGITGDEAVAAIRGTAAKAIAAGIAGPIGPAVAALSIEAAGKAVSSEAARSVLITGLTAITKSSSATGSEKILAQMGLDASSGVIGDAPVVRIRGAVASAIAAGVSGPLGPVLAAVSLDAAGKAGNSEAARSVLSTGLSAIVKNPATTQVEKVFAQLGLNASSGVCGDELVVQIRSAAASAIVAGISGPIGPALAVVTLKAAVNAGNSDAARSALITGLTEIVNNPASSGVEKKIAQFGIDASSGISGNSAVVNIRSTVAKALSLGIREPLQKAVAEIACDAARSAGDSSSARSVLGTACSVFIKGTEFSKEVKAIAQKAMDAGSFGSGGDMAVADARMKAMEQICGFMSPEEKARKEIEDMTEKLSPEKADNPAQIVVEEDSGTVEIDGVKISIKSGAGR